MSNETTTKPQARDVVLSFDRRLKDKLHTVRVVEYGKDADDDDEQEPA